MTECAARKIRCVTDPCTYSYTTQLRRLDDEFGDVIVCPGYTGKVGSAADAQGRLYLLGAVKGYKRTRGVFNAWQSKSVNDEKYNWWAAETKKRSIKPIAVSGKEASGKATRV